MIYVHTNVKMASQAESAAATPEVSSLTIDSGRKIKLNVGGTRFETSFETLTRIKHTYFSALFSGRWNLEEEIFIDRTPFTFEYVLEFLRGEEVDFPNISKKELSQLLKHADFFALASLKSKVMSHWKQLQILTDPNSAQLSIDKMSVTKVGLKNSKCIIIGPEFSDKLVEQRILIHAGNTFTFGIASLKKLKSKPAETLVPADCGFFIDSMCWKSYFHSELSSGKILSIVYHPSIGLSFGVNGSFFGPAFTNLSENADEEPNYVLCVFLFDTLSRIELLSS